MKIQVQLLSEKLSPNENHNKDRSSYDKQINKTTLIKKSRKRLVKVFGNLIQAVEVISNIRRLLVTFIASAHCFTLEDPTSEDNYNMILDFFSKNKKSFKVILVEKGDSL